jgi:citrate lyase beta subunit
LLVPGGSRTIRHFDFLDDYERRQLFHLSPQCFSLADGPEVVSAALGATLYSPGTRPELAKDLARQAERGLVSSVVCLEDAVADVDLGAAEQNAISQLRDYAHTGNRALLIFVRVRSAEQIPMILDGLGAAARILAGFVLPKFTARNGADYLAEVARGSAQLDRHLFAMPVIESTEVAHVESRVSCLTEIRTLLDRYREHVLAVRVGAADLSAPFGLRRARDLTVYDIRIVADAMSDIVNILGRAGSGFTVTGPVWEYFGGAERMFKPQLREAPFADREDRALRARLIARDLDGLIREVVLDQANGLSGKTVIHPSHIAPVHALSVVSQEDYRDAQDILQAAGVGGARASSYGNKMNESKPHIAWARRTELRGRYFGVANDAVTFVDVLSASLGL